MYRQKTKSIKKNLVKIYIFSFCAYKKSNEFLKFGYIEIEKRVSFFYKCNHCRRCRHRLKLVSKKFANDKKNKIKDSKFFTGNKNNEQVISLWIKLPKRNGYINVFKGTN